MVRRAVRRVRYSLPDRPARERDIERITAASVKEYKEQRDIFGSFHRGEEQGVLRAIPRRQFTQIKPGAPPEIRMAKKKTFHAGVWATFLRFSQWYRLAMAFQMAVLWDRIRRKDSPDTRAARLLKLCQTLGGTMIKIGQQLSMRMDMLPYEYCRELAKLLDSVKPFPVEEAIEAIERATRKPLAETFLLFDPEPIGSASIACVYQAVLKDGRKVAVKVRRPGIGHVFATDVRAMRWLVNALEAVAIVRPGYMQHFVREFEDTIMEELDFKLEAYHQSFFELEAKKFKYEGKPICSTPEVFYELSSDEVIVQEFVSGMWMWEVLAAVENKDQDALARMRELNIEPKRLAEKLLVIAAWSQYSAGIFHADPHPANIVAQQDGKLVFIDFGACGAMDQLKKAAGMDTLYFMMVEKDMAAFATSALANMEPLPPIDIAQYTKDVAAKTQQFLYKLLSKKAPWYEKTTATQGQMMLDVARRYQMPANLDTVRALRANLLYDTLALRIYPQLDTMRTARKYFEARSANAKRSSTKALRKRIAGGVITGTEIRSVQDLLDVAGRGIKTMRRLIDRPMVDFTSTIEKSAFAIIETVRLVVILSVALGLGWGGVLLYRYYHRMDLRLLETLVQVATSRGFHVVAGLISIVTIRRIMLRLGDAEVE